MSLHHQNWMDWIWNQSSSKWTQEQAEVTIMLMAIFYFHKNSMNFFFFFDHKMNHCKKLLPWRNSPDGSSFPRNFRLINVAQMGSGITLYQLSSHSWQPWRPSQPEFHRYFISYRNCISEHVLEGKCHELISPGAKAASNESARHVSSSILHLSTVPLCNWSAPGGVWGRRRSCLHPPKSQKLGTPVLSQLPAAATVMEVFSLASLRNLEIATESGRVASGYQK